MLEATQIAGGQSVFEEAQQWEGHVLANGNYRFRQYLGGSDHSAVFLTDIGVGQIRPPAIKLIAAHPGSADIQLARWKMAAKLSHPNLLQIFESGRCRLNGEELLFVVTENADETLAQILQQRAITPNEASEMLKPTLEVLAYLHENGYTHGRLTPSNVMAVGEQLKLSSDSLCRTGAAALFQRGAYDPPEAALEGLTPAGDIWALGMTMAEALTQHVPIWTDRLREEPTVPEAMPEAFADVVRHCLRRDPRCRWSIPQIKSRLKQPAPVLVPEPPRDVKPERVTAKPGKPGNKWVYAIPIFAMLATVLLLASLLRHRPSTANDSSAPQPGAAAAPATTQPVNKASARRDAHARRGALQTGSAAVPAVGDRIVHQAVPSVPERALRTIHGRVRVNVRAMVDSSGNVTGVALASTGPSRYFANLALQAARDWKFGAGQGDRSWLLQFVFENTGVTVDEHQVSRGA
jgi:TonB family protein